MHHQHLAHGLAVRRLRELGAEQLGISLNLTTAHPADPNDPVDVDAARRVDALWNRAFLDPLLHGRYPADFLADVAAYDLPALVRPGDLEIIAAPLDFLGVNHYHDDAVSGHPQRGPGGRRPTTKATSSPIVGSEFVTFPGRSLPRTAMDWEVNPDGLEQLLVRLGRDYPTLPPLYVTENGAAYADEVSADGQVHDPERVAFLDAHIAAVARAREAGADVRGFFAWSLFDNFEWAWGYAERFGLIHVDYATMRRTIKDSGWVVRADRRPCRSGANPPRIFCVTAPANGPATLKLVAAAAGVSKSTVSRVINDSPSVTPEAVAAVKAAIDQLGYTPNRAARTLVSRRAQTLALVIPENTARFFADPYFGSVVQGAAMAVSETEYILTLLIATESDADKTRRYLRAGNIDGALVLSHHSDDRSYLALAGTLPLVFGGRPMSAEGSAAYYVDVDNVAAARQITEHLVAAGRKRIATIAGPANMSAGIDRLEGWRQALAEAGQPADLVEQGDFSPGQRSRGHPPAAGARRRFRRVVRRQRPDGLRCA